MKDTRNSAIKIIFVLCMTAMVVAYAYFVAPFVISEIDKTRAQNAQIEYDLNEIKRLYNDEYTLSSDIKNAKKRLAEYKKRSEVDGSNFKDDIYAKGGKANISIDKIMTEKPEVVGEKNDNGKIFYRQLISLNFSGNFSEGIDFLREIEEGDTGLYKMRDFLYTVGSGNEKNEWMMSLYVYFREDGIKQ